MKIKLELPHLICHQEKFLHLQLLERKRNMMKNKLFYSKISSIEKFIKKKIIKKDELLYHFIFHKFLLNNKRLIFKFLILNIKIHIKINRKHINNDSALFIVTILFMEGKKLYSYLLVLLRTVNKWSQPYLSAVFLLKLDKKSWKSSFLRLAAFHQSELSKILHS